MEKKLNVTQVRDTLRELIDEVQYQGHKVIILRHGKPAGVLVPLSVYESWKANRERLFDLIDQMQAASRDNDSDEIMELVQEAQRATRTGQT